MHITHFRARTVPFALLLAAAAACTPAPYRVAQPAPAPSPAPMAEAVPDSVAPAPEKVDDAVALDRVPNGTVGRELLGTASYDLPVEPNQWVAMELSFLVNQRHDVVGRWLERSDRYAAFVQETFAAAGIPRDLHHLAMVESGYQPTARSHAGAVGMWQFMASTGRGMGLRIDDQVDERMDPVRSTRAAARHLRQLWEDFGHDWALAAAAYNAGGGRISRGLRNFSATGFWDLAERGDLAQETRRYVPRLYAVTIIAKDPARFGYARPAGVVQRFEFDSIQVDLSTPLPVLAKAGSISLAQLADLNPHLYRGIVPPFYWVWVPKGTGMALQQAYQASPFRRHGGYASYTLRRGEDATSVAQAAGLTMDELRDLNLSTNVDQLGRGDRIRLYADAARALDSRLSRDEDDGDSGRRSTRRSSSADDSGSRRARSSDDDASRTRTASAESRRSRSSDGDDDASSRRARSSDDDGSSRTRTASAESRRSRSSDGDDDASSRRARASDDDGSSRTRTASAESRRSRSSDGDDDASSRRARSSDDDGSSRTRTASAESRRSRSSDGDDDASSRRARSSEGDGSSPTRTASADSRRSRSSDGDDDTSSHRARSSDDDGSSRTRTASAESRRSKSSDDEESGSRTRRASGEGSSRSESRRTEATERLAARHTVEDGETLYAIARRYDVTVAALREANDLSVNAMLQSGQRLRIPRTERVAARDRDGGSVEARNSERRRDSDASLSARSGSRTRMAQHVVKSGETLWSIARTYDTTVAAIRSANDMPADTVLQPGQKIRVPRSSADDDR